MKFMGIEDFEVIVFEGADALPDQAESFKIAAVEKARKLARQF